MRFFKLAINYINEYVFTIIVQSFANAARQSSQFKAFKEI